MAIAVNDATVELIQEFEGFPNGGAPYNDPVGYSTVGYGHLIAYRNVTAADRRAIWVTGQKTPGRLTMAEAARLLQKDLQRSYAPAVYHSMKKPNENEFGACVSFTYNVGTGAFRSSTLLKKFNAGQRNAAANEFLKWNKAGGRALPGLTRRRKSERKLFLKRVKLAIIQPASKRYYSSLTNTEKLWLNALLAERRSAKRHGGWAKLDPSHLRNAIRAKAWLIERQRSLEAQKDKKFAARSKRIAAIKSAIKG